MADDKKPFEDKRYAILPRDSIKSYAESAGHEISDEVAALLAEDVIYRVREATMNACQFMRHAKRRKLTTADFNKGLKNSDVQPVLGYDKPSRLPFRHTRENELHFVEENDIDVASTSQTAQDVKQTGITTVKAHWLAVEGMPKSSLMGTGHGIKSLNKLNPVVSDDLLKYYDNMTKAILGQDDKVVKHAFLDLQKNTKISPLLPYFVNFVNNGVKTVSHDISQLLKLLHTVKSLVCNKSLFLEPKPYLDLLVQTVLYCLLEPLAASINPLNDHWALRDYAARLLAQITREWTTPVNQLKRHNISALREVFYDTGKQFCSHYGAVMGIIAFGPKAIERVLLPNLHIYWMHLQRPTNTTADSQKVVGALMLAVEWIINLRGKELLHPSLAPSIDEQEDGNDAGLGLDDLALYTSATPISATVPVLAEAQVSSTPADGSDPSTSTPIKPGIHFPHLDLLGPVLELPDNKEPTPVTSTPAEQDAELVGTVLTLPETNTPPTERLTLSELYKQVAEYFGDSLTTRLPIHQVHDMYVQKEQLPVVSLADQDSKKSGEELLQQFLHVAHNDSENMDMKSENQSCDPTLDDIEMDDEKSERSSRSEHSDDSTYMDSNLTVKAVVDPSSAGIKLTFRKMPRIEPSLPPPPPIPQPIPATVPIIKIRRKFPDSEVFEREDFCPPHLKTTFVFVYAGMVQEGHLKPKKERTIFDDSHAQWSGTLLMLASKMYGRRKGSPKMSNRRLHQHTSSLFNCL